jgi:hypothetical protein
MILLLLYNSKAVTFAATERLVCMTAQNRISATLMLVVFVVAVALAFVFL